MDRHELVLVADAEEATERGAARIAAKGGVQIDEKGSFTLAVSGGGTPWRMLSLLAGELDFSRTELSQVDERIAPAGSAERNLTHLIEALPLSAQAAIRPMPVNDEDLEAAAGRYGTGLPGSFDLIHLGLGPDGHTASLIPGDPVLEVIDRPVAITEVAYQGHRRMTLTYPILGAAAEIVWLVTGEEKRAALEGLLAGDESIPAGRVRARSSVVIADRAAAGERG